MNVPALRFKEFSGDWENKVLKEISLKITDGTHDTPKPVQEGLPYLTAIHIKDGFIDYENCYYLTEEDHNKIYKRCNPEKGDLLIVNIGAGTATCAINTVTYEFSLKNVALIKPDKLKIFPEYLLQVQRKNSLKQFNTLTAGGAQPFLSLSEIGKIKISLPSLPEQTKIANFLTAVDDKITLLTKKADLLSQYKKGVMQQIFSQELRFKDDDGQEFPAWEEKMLGDLCSIVTGKLDANAMVENGEYRFYTCAKEYYQIDKYAFDTDALLISGNGANVGYIHHYKGKFNAYQRTYVLDGFKQNILFMKYFLDTHLYARIFTEKKEGNTPYIVMATLTEMQVYLPTLEEQTKIAKFLTAIDEKITNNQTQLVAVKQYKQGLLQQMFV